MIGKKSSSSGDDIAKRKRATRAALSSGLIGDISPLEELKSFYIGSEEHVRKEIDKYYESESRETGDVFKKIVYDKDTERKEGRAKMKEKLNTMSEKESTIYKEHY